MKQGLYLGVIALIVAGACYGLFYKDMAKSSEDAGVKTELAKVYEKLTQLEQRLTSLEARKPAIELAGPRDLQERIKALEAALAEREAAALALAKAGDKKPGAVIAAPKAGSEAFKKEVLAAVQKDIDQAVEKKAKELARRRRLKRGGDVKLAELSEALKLDDRQTAVLEREAREAQKQAQDLLATPGEDGVRPIDTLVEAMAYQKLGRPEAGPKFMAFIGALGKEVPGTGQTYGAALQVINNSGLKSFRRELTEQQAKSLSELKVDLQKVEGFENRPWDAMGPQVEARAAEIGKGGADSEGF